MVNEMGEKITIKGKAKDFNDLLKYGSINGVLDEIGMTVKDGVIGVVSLDDAKSGGKFTHVGRYEQFSIEGSGMFAVNSKDILKYIAAIYKNDDDLSMVIYKDIVITGPLDKITTARIDPESLNTFMEKPPFVMTDDWVALYKKGTIEPSTKVEMPSSIFKEMVQKSELVEQNYFPMRFDKDGVLYYKVGTHLQDRTNDEISSKAGGIKVEGEGMTVIMAGGFPETVKILKGDIFVSGTNDAPLWIRMESEKMKIGYFLAPMVEDEEPPLGEKEGEGEGE